jgi:hypothetical protein
MARKSLVFIFLRETFLFSCVFPVLFSALSTGVNGSLLKSDCGGHKMGTICERKVGTTCGNLKGVFLPERELPG